MFRNLQAEIVRKGMNNIEFASVIEMNYRTFSNKLLGKTEFCLDEMKIIKKAIGNDCTLEYLFEKNDE
jgi:hypothetical protein